MRYGIMIAFLQGITPTPRTVMMSAIRMPDVDAFLRKEQGSGSADDTAADDDIGVLWQSVISGDGRYGQRHAEPWVKLFR